MGADIRGLVRKSKSKCVARNEMESGFENGTSKFQFMLFNRKEKLKNEMESGFENGTSKFQFMLFNRKES